MNDMELSALLIIDACAITLLAVVAYLIAVHSEDLAWGAA